MNCWWAPNADSFYDGNEIAWSRVCELRRGRRVMQTKWVLLAFCILDVKAYVRQTQTEEKITEWLREEVRANGLSVICIIWFKLNTFQMLMSAHINVKYVMFAGVMNTCLWIWLLDVMSAVSIVLVGDHVVADEWLWRVEYGFDKHVFL